MTNHITYIGARYVPKFAQPAQWSKENEYEPLTIVLNQGNSYTSRRAVPKGIDLKNDEYWAMTGNYNAQIELYRAEVDAFDERIKNTQDTANTANTKAEAAQATADANTTAIADETERAQGEEAYLEGEISRVSNEVAAETERATGAEAVNAAAITAETERARAAENSNAGKIAQNAVDIKKNAADIKYKPMCGYLEPEYLGRFAANYSESVQAGIKIDNRIIQFVEGTNRNPNGTIYQTVIGSNTITSKQINNWFHGQSFAYDGTDLYMLPLFDTAPDGVKLTNKLLKVDPVTFETREVIEVPTGSIYAICYDEKTKKYYIVSNSASISGNKFYEWHPETNTLDLLHNLTDSEFFHLQDVAIYDGLLLMAHYDPNYIYVYDVNTFELISTIQLPASTSYMWTQEIESVTIEPNYDVYVNFAGRVGDSTYKYATWAKFNLITGSSTVTLDNPDTYGGLVRVYVTAAEPNSKFYANGSKENPFTTLAESVYSFLNNPFAFTIYATGTFNEHVQVPPTNGKCLRLEGESREAFVINGYIESFLNPLDVYKITVNAPDGKNCLTTLWSGTVSARDFSLSSNNGYGISSHGNVELQTSGTYRGNKTMVYVAGAYIVSSYQNISPTITYTAPTASIYMGNKTIL